MAKDKKPTTQEEEELAKAEQMDKEFQLYHANLVKKYGYALRGEVTRYFASGIQRELGDLRFYPATEADHEMADKILNANKHLEVN